MDFRWSDYVLTKYIIVLMTAPSMGSSFQYYHISHFPLVFKSFLRDYRIEDYRRLFFPKKKHAYRGRLLISY